MATLTSPPPRLSEPKDPQILDFVERVSPEADPTSVMLFRQVKRADRLLTRFAEKELEIAGLSWPRLMLLMVLQGHETFGSGEGLQPSELSDLQGIPRNNVSALLAALEEEGLVSRELHGKDRRKFVIRITPEGRRILKSNLGTQFEQISKCFAALSHDERTTLLDLLTRLNQSLSEMNDHNRE